MGFMHLYFPKGRMPAWRPPFSLFLVYILHHVLHTALQQPQSWLMVWVDTLPPCFMA